MSKKLVTRKDLAAMGLIFSPTHWGRLEKMHGLKVEKAGGRRSARVHYWLDDVLRIFKPMTGTRKHTGAS